MNLFSDRTNDPDFWGALFSDSGELGIQCCALNHLGCDSADCGSDVADFWRGF